MTSNDILPTHKSVPHSRLIREASPCRRWESTQKLRNGKCAASESSGVPRSKRGCFYQTYALKVKGLKQKRSGVRVTEMDCIQFTSSEAAEYISDPISSSEMKENYPTVLIEEAENMGFVQTTDVQSLRLPWGK